MMSRVNHELLLVLVAAWCFLVAVLGGLLGLVLGNIRLPVLLLIASSPAAGAGANIAVSGVTAAAAAVGHIRAGRIEWSIFRVMAIPSIIGAVLGGVASSSLPGSALLLLIGVLLLYFGIDLLRPRAATREPQPEASRRMRTLAISGAWIGFLGGVVGLILGALRMPALLRNFPDIPKRLIGTNLAVGVLVGAAGALAHAPTAFDLTLFAVGAAASIPGALIGARLTGRIPDQHLVHGIGVALLIGGTTTLVRAVLELAG